MREYSIQELALMSVNSASKAPMGRKIRPLRQDIMNAANLPPTDKQAEEKMKLEYHGKKKPPLVLQFVFREGHWETRLSKRIRVEIHLTYEGSGKFDPAQWTASIAAANLKGKRTYRQRLSARDLTPAKAARKLFEMHWLFDGAEWRPLTWVYKSIVMFGISDAQYPKCDYETTVKSGNQLHVPGIWVWNAKVLVVPKSRPRTVLPLTTPKMVRTPTMPDIRNSEGYIDEERGKPVRGRKFWSGNGWVNLNGVIKAPVPQKFSGKDPNPRRIISVKTFEGHKPIKEWMDAKEDREDSPQGS